MSVETFSFFIGSALLVAGLLGGGIKIKEIEIPALRPMARILAVIMSLAFLSIGLLFRLEILPFHTKNSDEVLYTIQNILGQDQRGEEVDITIDGEKVGRLHVDQISRSDSVELKATPGRHSFELAGVGMYAIGRDFKTLPVTGRGYISVSPGAIFSIERNKITDNEAELAVIRNFEFKGPETPMSGTVIIAQDVAEFVSVSDSETEFNYSLILKNSNSTNVICVVDIQVFLEKDGGVIEVLNKKSRTLHIPGSSSKTLSGKMRARKGADDAQGISELAHYQKKCDFEEVK